MTKLKATENKYNSQQCPTCLKQNQYVDKDFPVYGWITFWCEHCEQHYHGWDGDKVGEYKLIHPTTTRAKPATAGKRRGK